MNLALDEGSSSSMWNESQNLPFAVETLHTRGTITLRANTPFHCSASVVIYFASGSFLLRHSRQSNRSNLLATRLYRYRIISHHMSSTASKRRNTSGGMAGGGSSSNKRGGGLSLHAILSHILVGIGGIYIGLMMGMHTCGPSTTMMTTVDGKGNGGGQQGGVPIPPQEQRQQQEIFVEDTKSKSKTASSTASSEKVKFPESVSKLVMDYATVPRDDFNELLEIGVPMDEVSDKDGMKEVLVLYTDEKTLPFRKKQDKKKDFGPKEGIDAKTALENCHTVRVILQEPAKGNGKRQCIAIVSQWESWHIHKFMRMPKKFDGVQVDVKYPLRYVSRSMQDSGKDNKFPQLKKDTVPSYAGLIEYLTNLDRILGELKPILSDALNQSNHGDKSTTSDVMKKSKSMVVMVCNKGQAHLFHNFVCNARSKGLDLSRIIMFATDKYTVQLCHDLNIHVYYDETIFGDMPETAARRYGDKIFSQMMMAKVYCVHLVMSLGYDVLFQDVDVVWNQNPLEYLNTVESKEWDMMFQDDGSRQARYNPYSPNTGTLRNIGCLRLILFSTL